MAAMAATARACRASARCAAAGNCAYQGSVLRSWLSGQRGWHAIVVVKDVFSPSQGKLNDEVKATHFQSEGKGVATLTGDVFDVPFRPDIQVSRPTVAINGALHGRRNLRESTVEVPVSARWVSRGELQNGASIAGRGIGCRESNVGGAQLRLFSSANGEAESGSLVSEETFHSVANDTLDMLQEKIEAYGEDLDVDGFDLDYSDGVMTIRLGDLGTYVINKQTPNRQLWLSSPVSGPARLDWNTTESVWVYRRNKAELVSLLEQELSKLLGSPVTLRS